MVVCRVVAHAVRGDDVEPGHLHAPAASMDRTPVPMRWSWVKPRAGAPSRGGDYDAKIGGSHAIARVRRLEVMMDVARALCSPRLSQSTSCCSLRSSRRGASPWRGSWRPPPHCARRAERPARPHAPCILTPVTAPFSRHSKLAAAGPRLLLRGRSSGRRALLTITSRWTTSPSACTPLSVRCACASNSSRLRSEKAVPSR